MDGELKNCISVEEFEFLIKSHIFTSLKYEVILYMRNGEKYKEFYQYQSQPTTFNCDLPFFLKIIQQYSRQEVEDILQKPLQMQTMQMI